MRLFGGDRLKRMMEQLNIPDDVPLQNAMVSRSIESAQKRVEGRNFDVRRHVLQYDNVLNKHRDIIYKRRQRILQRIAEAEDGRRTGEEGWALHHDILESLRKELHGVLDLFAAGIDPDAWKVGDLHVAIAALHPDLGRSVPLAELSLLRERAVLEERVKAAAEAFYNRKCATHDPETVAQAERVITLRCIDAHWMDHIDEMAHLRERVSLAGLAQRDPLIEYQDQGFRLFQLLLFNIQAAIVRTAMQVDFGQFQPQQALREAEEELAETATNIAAIEEELTQTGVGEAAVDKSPAPRSPVQGLERPPPAPCKVGRNDPCPCGSGKKHKKCHGKG